MPPCSRTNPPPQPRKTIRKNRLTARKTSQETAGGRPGGKAGGRFGGKADTHFGAFGVTREQIEHRIQRRLDAIQPAQIVAMKKVYASLRDGMSVAADWFEPTEQPDAQAEQQAATRTDAVKQAMRSRKKAETEPEKIPAADLPDAGNDDFRAEL